MGMVLRILLFANSQIEESLLDLDLSKRGCTSDYKALASLGFLQLKSLQTSCRLMEMQYIFGYRIGTVNMDRCHGSQISRALNFFRPQRTFLVN